MPASSATKSYGSILSYSTTSGGTYTKVAQTVDLGGPEPTVGKISILNNDSPSNTKEYLAGLIEPGAYSFSLIHRPADTATIYALMDAQTTYFWKVTFQQEGKTDDGAITTKCEIQLAGFPTFTAGS
jgi:hypothetical protein